MLRSKIANEKSLTKGQKKMASYLHHTATTVYPCCVPTLGDSTGAGCVGLAAAKIRSFLIFATNFKLNLKSVSVDFDLN